MAGAGGLTREANGDSGAPAVEETPVPVAVPR
jgi:hypothetical protein